MKSVVDHIYNQNGRNIEFEETLTVYNLGSGKQRYKNVIGVDLLDTPGADIQHNLDKFPWPIESNSTDVILLFHTFEHLDNLPKVMEEMYRILKPGGKVVIEVPYFRHPGAFQDPTHKHFFTSQTLAYFCEPKQGTRPPGPLYADVKFKQLDFWFGWPPKSRNPLMQLFKDFCRKHHDFYDKYLSLFFPSKIIIYEIEAIK